MYFCVKVLYIASGSTNIDDTWFSTLQEANDQAAGNGTLNKKADPVPENSTEQGATLDTNYNCPEFDNIQQPNPDHSNFEDPQLIISKFQEMSSKIIERVSNNPSLLLPLEKMMSTYNKLIMDSALESALVTFGKYNSAIKKSSKRFRSLWRQSVDGFVQEEADNPLHKEDRGNAPRFQNTDTRETAASARF